MAQVPGATTMCITADVTGLPHIARWAFVTATGRAFDAVINPRPARLDSTEEQPTTVQFVCYGNSAGYRPDLAANPAGTRAWVDEFLAVAPELRGRVLGVHLQTRGSTASRSSRRSGRRPSRACSSRSAGCTSPGTTPPHPRERTAPTARPVASPTSSRGPHDLHEDVPGRRGPLRHPDAGHHRRSTDHPRRHRLPADAVAGGERRPAAPADVAGTPGIPGRVLQPRRAGQAPGRRRRLHHHGAGRIPRHERREHHRRGDGPPGDRHDPDAGAGHRVPARGPGRPHRHPGALPEREGHAGHLHERARLRRPPRRRDRACRRSARSRSTSPGAACSTSSPTCGSSTGSRCCPNEAASSRGSPR